jgi:hypothetical protein
MHTVMETLRNWGIDFVCVVVRCIPWSRHNSPPPPKKTPWPESASELCRPGERRLLAKLVLTFEDRGCHVVSVMDPYGRNLDFLDRSRYFFFQVAFAEVTYLDRQFEVLPFNGPAVVNICKQNTLLTLHAVISSSALWIMFNFLFIVLFFVFCTHLLFR